MAIDFRTAPTLTFPPTKGRPQTQVTSVTFNSRVLRAEVALRRFDIGYSAEDHHVLREVIQTNIEAIEGNRVRVRVNYLFRDSSGNIDDSYQGTVEVLVLAEVA